MTINRWRNVLLVAVTIAVGGCGSAGATTSTTSTVATSPTAAPTAIPTLASTTEQASQAPTGSIPIKMALPNAEPRFEPDSVTAKAGTVVFFLENVPGAIGSPDHNMRIGPAVGQVLAATPNVRAKGTVTFTVSDLAPGTYLYWCSVVGLDGNSHAYNGMVGTLTVTP